MNEKKSQCNIDSGIMDNFILFIPHPFSKLELLHYSKKSYFLVC